MKGWFEPSKEGHYGLELRTIARQNRRKQMHIALLVN